MRLVRSLTDGFSALQRAEIAEILLHATLKDDLARFSALQRAEIAEIQFAQFYEVAVRVVSVLFNEPKLLKLRRASLPPSARHRFSALQRAEIAEMSAGCRDPA